MPPSTPLTNPPRLQYTPPTPPPTTTSLAPPYSPSPSRPWRLLKSYLALPGTRALLFYLLALTSFLLYGKANFYRDPGSIFFDESRAYERWYSAWRGRQAEMFWGAGLKAVEQLDLRGGVGVGVDEATHGGHGDDVGATGVARKVIPGFGGVLNPLSLGKAGPQPEVCVVFMTVERSGLERQYIESALSSLLHALTPTERRSLHLSLLFASTHPATHPTYSSPLLPLLLDSILTYPSLVDSDTLATLASYEVNGESHGKGVLDYTLALSHCHSATSAPYIAVFEDDILLAEGWFARTLLALREVSARMEAREHSAAAAIAGAASELSDQWLYLRLFNQERSIGWSGTIPLSNNEPLLILLISPSILFLLLLLRRHSRTSPLRSLLTPGVLLVISLLLIPSTILLFFASGKASLLPPSPGIYDEPFGCCSQALVFNRARVPGLVGYLRENYAARPELPSELRRKEVGKYDMMTRDYARGEGLTRWSLYPVVVQHVGVHSSIDGADHESQAIWSMAFENLNPKSLARDHARMVKELYGDQASTKVG